MANTVLQTVNVEALSKFGFKSNGEYINWSKTIKEADKVNVVPGRTFQMELYIADSGKKYVNKVVNMINTADVPAPVKAKPVKEVDLSAPKLKMIIPSEDKPMLRADWDAKDRRISRQGVIQAAVQALAPYHSDVDSLAGEAVKLANLMLMYVQEK